MSETGFTCKRHPGKWIHVMEGFTCPRCDKGEDDWTPGVYTRRGKSYPNRTVEDGAWDHWCDEWPAIYLDGKSVVLCNDDALADRITKFLNEHPSERGPP